MTCWNTGEIWKHSVARVAAIYQCQSGFSSCTVPIKNFTEVGGLAGNRSSLISASVINTTNKSNWVGGGGPSFLLTLAGYSSLLREGRARTWNTKHEEHCFLTRFLLLAQIIFLYSCLGMVPLIGGRVLSHQFPIMVTPLRHTHRVKDGDNSPTDAPSFQVTPGCRNLKWYRSKSCLGYITIHTL